MSTHPTMLTSVLSVKCSQSIFTSYESDHKYNMKSKSVSLYENQVSCKLS